MSKQSGFGYEDETIIQRGTKFRVIKVEKKGADIFFDVEVIEQI
jgi:c-di-GMP-binding flagellar brake protein YcgR